MSNYIYRVMIAADSSNTHTLMILKFMCVYVNVNVCIPTFKMLNCFMGYTIAILYVLHLLERTYK